MWVKPRGVVVGAALTAVDMLWDLLDVVLEGLYRVRLEVISRLLDRLYPPGTILAVRVGGAPIWHGEGSFGRQWKTCEALLEGLEVAPGEIQTTVALPTAGADVMAGAVSRLLGRSYRIWAEGRAMVFVPQRLDPQAPQQEEQRT